jgi:hypothetical protein
VIVVPVILHLWNDRRGKVLRIGSVRLLTGDSRQMSWSRRVSQWWLLLLRCLLLCALAVLLARPYWRRSVMASGKGWVLVADSRERLADSLVNAGWEQHTLEDSGNYWNGFRIADRVAPAGVPFYVLTTALARRFAGERPSTEREVHWDVYAPEDSVRRWIRSAWLLPGDSIRVLEGVSRSTGSFYTGESVAAKDGMEKGFRVREQNGRWAVALDSQPPVVVDTSVLRVTIVTDPVYRQDGRYVEAALRALQLFTKRRMLISVTGGLPGAGPSGNGSPGAGGDWLFWLSVRSVAGLREFTHILQYEQGKEKTVDTRVEGVEWMREVEGPAEGQRVLWKDGYGRAVLTVEGEKGYHFYSHFDPDWNGLVWSPSFPVIMERLLFGEDRMIAEDRRVLDAEQIVPVRVGTTGPGESMLRNLAIVRQAINVGAARGGLGTVDLAPVLWIVIVLLFISERVLSHGKRKT